MKDKSTDHQPHNEGQKGNTQYVSNNIQFNTELNYHFIIYCLNLVSHATEPSKNILKKLLQILFIFPFFLTGQNIDSLKLALKNAKHDTTRCSILNAMIEAEADDNIWPKYNNQLLKLCENKIKLISKTSSDYSIYLKHYAGTLNNVGYLANKQGDIHKAKEYFIKSLKVSEEVGDKNGIANSLNHMGLIYKNQGDIPMALEYYGKSLKISEEIGDKQGIAVSLSNIGLIYNNQGDIPKALEYYGKSLQIQEEIGDKQGVAISLNNIGLIYLQQGDNAKSLECTKKSLKIREEIGDKQGIAGSLNNIGFLFDDQGDTPKALEYYVKSLKIWEEIGDKRGISGSLNNIGFVHFKQKNYSSALMYANKSMKLSRDLGFPENIGTAAKILNQIYKATGNYKLAYENYELFIQMRDSVNNEKTQKAAVKKQMQYQYETQARELKNEQDKKDIIAKAELKQREKERNYFIIGFALVIVLALFVFRSYRQKQKANLIITQQKHEVEESRKEILDSIHYAKRIQKALLPTHNYIDKNLNRLRKN